MTTSGTTAFALSGADLVLEAFDRLQIRPSAITADHMVSARRSMNLVQVRWANRGTNLWKVDPAGSPTQQALSQGVATYDLLAGTIMLLDCYLRVFPMGPTVNIAPSFNTSAGSSVVAVNLPNHGLSVGQYSNIIVPVAVGGLILFGFYPVQSVTSGSQFTIAAASPAAATVTGGGAVPVFATVQGSPLVSVALPNHGYLAGQTFAVQVPTTVGGITLSGPYTIAAVADSGDFTFSTGVNAGSAQTLAENGGRAQLAGQVQNADPLDRVLAPLSRTDYAALPDKGQQGPPTSYYFDRQSTTPTVTLWPVPDGNGPYQFRAYTVQQMQDATALASQGPDVPYRFLEALCADLALHLAKKYPPRPDSGIAIADLRADAAEAWHEAASEDRERVPVYLAPDLSGYFR
jgi:hypothetical protein